MKRTVFTLLFIYGIIGLIGCAKDSNNNGGGTVVVNPVCPTGYILNTSNQCVAAVIYDNSPKHYRISSVTITSSGVQRSFVKEALMICDRSSWINTGVYDCNNWANGNMAIDIDVSSPNSNTAFVTISAEPNSAWVSDFLSTSFSVGLNRLGKAANPLMITLNIAVINNSAGFSMYRIANANDELNPTDAYNKKLELNISNGKLVDSYLDIEIKYGGNTLGTGRAILM